METSDAAPPPGSTELEADLEAQIEEATRRMFADPAEADRILLEVTRRAEAAGAGDATARAFGALARAQRAHARRETEVMRQEAQFALEHLPLPLCRPRGIALQLLGRAAQARGVPDEAGGFFQQGLTEATEAGSSRGQGVFHSMLGSLEMARGNLEQAAAHCLRARAIHRLDDDRGAEEKALYLHGLVLTLGGAFIEAIVVFQEAADLCRELGHRGLLAGRLTAAADAQRLAGRFEETLANVNEAHAIVENSGDDSQLAYVLSVLSRARVDVGDLAGGLAAAEEYLALVRRMGNGPLLASALGSLAMACLANQQLERADALAQEAVRQSSRARVPAATCGAHITAGEIALCAGRLEEAIESLGEGLAMIPNQDSRRRAEVHGLLARAHQQRGDLEAAVEALETKVRLIESTAASEAAIRFRHIRAVLHVERAEAAAAKAERRVARALLEAQDEERRRISRELHDDLSQRMALHVMDLDALAETLPPTVPDSRKRTRTLAKAIRATASSMHQISRRLHPAMLERLGLIATTQSFLTELEERHGIDIELVTTGIEERTAPDVELCLFRVIQEALQNVVRHSKANTARVSLARETREIRLVIEDQGRGFDAATAQTVGIGLIGMRERTRHVGGSLYLRSAPGSGTRIEVRVPLAPS